MSLKSSIHLKKLKPKLAIVSVGDRPDSTKYISAKKQAANKIGISCDIYALSPLESPEKLITHLNAQNDVDGIILQLPLPPSLALKSRHFANLILPGKDVDWYYLVFFSSLNVYNIGALYSSSKPLFYPCTAKASMCFVREYFCKTGLSGLYAVVVGRSNIAGRPIAQLLLDSNATVTVCHSQTISLEQHLSKADIVVSAVGKASYIRGHWLKPGSVVIDVGINRSPENDSTLGDVCFEEAIQHKVGAITPVPGGVGPMTVAMLMENVVQAASFNKSKSC